MTTHLESLPLKTACIIVAGGSGTRIGGDEPKQFRLLAGTPLLGWSVRYFGNHPSISELVVVVPVGWESRAAELLTPIEVSVPLKIVTGGSQRQDSVLAGIQACPSADVVAIHDGARPFPPENLDEALAVVGDTNAAIFAMPVTDSIKNVSGHTIQNTVPRAGLWAAQTPQIFRRDLLLQALKQCKTDAIELTDDASAFEYMQWPVSVVTGSRLNVKITYAEDFIMAEHILKGRIE